VAARRSARRETRMPSRRLRHARFIGCLVGWGVTEVAGIQGRINGIDNREISGIVNHMTSYSIGNYRIERVRGGTAVFWRDEPARGLANAIRVFPTYNEARHWATVTR
jgi:hypothetical protein